MGPAAIVNAHRFISDSRDDAAHERLDILNDREGVWRCRTIFNCTEVCPREIRITKAIGEVKKAILKGSPAPSPSATPRPHTADRHGSPAYAWPRGVGTLWGRSLSDAPVPGHFTLACAIFRCTLAE
ncbi:MAG TPA: hypothetical protein VHG30_15870 [Microvirga sp.]|nr:hypothetical protein [Microvirga sp.]